VTEDAADDTNLTFDGRELLAPSETLARCSIRKRFNSRTYSRQNSSKRSRRSLSRSATRTHSSTSWLLIVRRLVHVPRERTPKQAKQSRQYRTYQPPHSAHFV
jgi:hypothetical protein